MAGNRCRARGRTAPARIGLGMGIVLVALAVSAGESRADRISLRGGGQIRGKVLPDPEHPDRVTILTTTGKTPLSFEKARILQVQAEPSALDEYVDRRAAVAPTAVAHYELGLWCAEHGLKDLSTIHFEAALKQDRTYGPAHQKLGHVFLGDHWAWGDELREAQGLVRYKGQWISKEEKERRLAEEANSAEQASWVRRLKLLRQALHNGPDDRRRDAETQLMEIRDPVAVMPLVQVFGGEGEPLRILLDHILELIPGPEAAAALVMHVLAETDSDVRHVAVDALAGRKEANVVPGLVKALGSKNPAVINRAAWSLGQLNAVTTVPKLIPALITTQYRIVMPSLAGLSGGGIGASFGSVAPTPGLGLGGSYIGYGATYPLLTPPAVGSGAVGFGATSIPYTAMPGSSLSLGGGGSGGRGPIPRIVPLTFRNVEVLAALNKMTGQDFGFDIPAWRRWVSSSFQPDPTPVRRVPQP